MATRTWVSGVGDDANPCSRTAPCKTFAGAISKTAAGGEIDVLDPGGFGAVTITKGMTLDGTRGSGFGSILASGTSGIIVNAGANDVVTLRNLSINGAGTGIAGIRILAARSVFIENCEIFGFRATAGTDAGIGIRDSRTTGGHLTITGCTVRNNLNVGIVVTPSSGSNRISTFISNSWLQGNGGGVSNGINTLTTIYETMITGNQGVAIAIQGFGFVTECNVESCVIAHNGTGIQTNNGSPFLRLSNTTVVNNSTGFQLTSGTVASWVNNRITQNVPGGGSPTPGQTIAFQ